VVEEGGRGGGVSPAGLETETVCLLSVGAILSFTKTTFFTRSRNGTPRTTSKNQTNHQA